MFFSIVLNKDFSKERAHMLWEVSEGIEIREIIKRKITN